MLAIQPNKLWLALLLLWKTTLKKGTLKKVTETLYVHSIICIYVYHIQMGWWCG